MCQESCDLDAIVTALNELPEKEGLKLPVPVHLMNWPGFQIYTGLPQRELTSCRVVLRALRPRSLRQLVFMMTKVFGHSNVPGPCPSWVTVGILIGQTGEYVRAMYENYEKFMNGKVKEIGRPKKLNPEQENLIIREIDEKYKAKTPMTKRDIMLFIYDSWKITVSKRFVTRLVDSREEITHTTAHPIEQLRAEVTKDELEKFYEQLQELLIGVHPCNIINVDEVGFSRRSSMKPLHCVVPTFASEQRVEYIPRSDVDRTFTMVAAISLNGQFLLPMLVCPVKSLPTDFMTNQIWQGTDCFLAHSGTGFVNRDTFCFWYEKVFRPHLKQNRDKLGCKDSPAVLICDGFRAHSNEEFKAKAAEDGVRVVFIPPHSSHLTQPLDKYAFANLKGAYERRSGGEGACDRMGRKIRNIVKAFYETFIPFTIRSSWEAVGISTTRNAAGDFLNTFVNGTEVVNRHSDLRESASHRRKRTPLEHHLVNREELDRATRGLCPLCGASRMTQQEPPQPEARCIIRLRLPEATK